jgi:hypothetical protein
LCWKLTLTKRKKVSDDMVVAAFVKRRPSDLGRRLDERPVSAAKQLNLKLGWRAHEAA